LTRRGRENKRLLIELQRRVLFGRPCLDENKFGFLRLQCFLFIP
jgi:hypothetical protein